MDGDTIARVIYLGLLLLAVGGYLVVEGRREIGSTLRAAAAWGLIFIGILAGYGLWSDIRNSITPRLSVASDGRIEVPRAIDGHYYLTLDIDGTPVRFVVDTGASDVVLSRDDAQKLGIDTNSLSYFGTAYTANGTVRTAQVRLNDVRLGPITDHDVSASVNDGAMDGSLLGMSYLQRFSRIEISNGRLILTR